MNELPIDFRRSQASYGLQAAAIASRIMGVMRKWRDRSSVALLCSRRQSAMISSSRFGFLFLFGHDPENRFTLFRIMP
jgi:hypothetical protein